MLGLIIYDRLDYNKNTGFVDWIIDEGKKKELDIVLIFSDEFKNTGVELTNVAFAINRSRSYEISLILELNGIRVFNSSKITLLGNNKLAAYGYVQNLGMKIPKVLSQWENGMDIISKPIDGHGGEGIDFVSNVDLKKGSFRLQQEYLKDLQGDVRFYIINNKIIHSVIRSSSKGIASNYSQGGNIKLFAYTDYHEKLVNRVLEDLQADYIGVDFLVTNNGELIFNEIEDAVGSRMLSKLGINNTVELFLEHIKGIIDKV